MFMHKRGQSTLEYSIIIAVVVAALLAIQIYMKRGIQGRLRSSTDDIGEQFDAKRTSFNYTTKRSGKTVEKTTAGVTASYGGVSGSYGSTPEVTERSGSETVEGWQNAPPSSETTPAPG